VYPHKKFMETIKGSFSRKMLSSPHTYRLARQVFLRGGHFHFSAKKMMTAMALEQAAEAYQEKGSVAWTSAFFPSELFFRK